MRGFLTLTWTEFKLFLREPAAVFFTLAFPLMLLFMFGSIFGNDPSADLGGRGGVDNSVPGYLAMIIGTTTFMSIPIVISEYRNQGIFRRLRATPLNPLAIIGAQVVIYFVMTLLGFILLYIGGKIVFDLATPEQPFKLLAVILLSFLSLAAMGFAIGAFFKTSRTANVVGNIVYFPQIFLAGAALPREIMSDTLRKWTEWLPMTQVVNMTKAAWFSAPIEWWSILYVAGLGLVCLVISVKVFKWE